MPDPRDSQSETSRAPRFSVRLARSLDWRWRYISPIRFYFGRDGDGTNEHLWFGVEWLQAGSQDSLWSLGLELVIPPRMFWLLKPLELLGVYR